MKRRVRTLVLTPYEQAVLKGFAGEVVEVVDEKRTGVLVNKILGTRVTHDLEDGTKMEFTIEELLVSKNIMHAINKPKGLETIMELQKIRGELKDVKEIQLSLVDNELRNRGFRRIGSDG